MTNKTSARPTEEYLAEGIQQWREALREIAIGRITDDHRSDKSTDAVTVKRLVQIARDALLYKFRPRAAEIADTGPVETGALVENCEKHGPYRLNAAGCPVCWHEKQTAQKGHAHEIEQKVGPLGWTLEQFVDDGLATCRSQIAIKVGKDRDGWVNDEWYWLEMQRRLPGLAPETEGRL